MLHHTNNEKLIQVKHIVLAEHQPDIVRQTIAPVNTRHTGAQASYLPAATSRITLLKNSRKSRELVLRNSYKPHPPGQEWIAPEAESVFRIYPD